MFTLNSELTFFKWLHGHLLPCPFKFITGVDCPGCGFQRSVLALLEGDLYKSFALYPATIPFLFAVTFTLVSKRIKLDNDKQIARKSIYIITAFIITASYSIKLFTLYKLSI